MGTSSIVNNNSIRERIHYLDIAKGVLILMVIYNHTGNLAEASGITNSTINFIPSTRFFKSFFMPAFFIITGMCSNFKKPLKEFIISNAKALLIPAITLLLVRVSVRYILTGTVSSLELSGLMSKKVFFNLGYWNWFLTALFTTKVIFYLVTNYVKKDIAQVVILLSLHIIGILIYNFKTDSHIFFNFYFYQHALMFAIYIWIGNNLSKIIHKPQIFWSSIFLFSITYLLYLLLGGAAKLPSITSDPYLPIRDIFPHFIMSTCGSIALIYICKQINRNRILEEIGKNTLVIYCLHFQFMFSFYEIFRDQLCSMNTHQTITTLIIMYIFTVVGCLAFSKLLNTKYLKFILGKF